MKSWVKLYTEINRDPKMARLTWAHKGVWAALLALAGELDRRNGDGSENGELDTFENTAWRLRCDPDTLSDALKTFTEHNMIHTVEGILYVTNYPKRQARPPSASRKAVRQRVAEYRAQLHNEAVTGALRVGDDQAHWRNEDVTTLQDDVTRCNEDVTPLEEKRVDTEEIQIREEADSSSLVTGDLFRLLESAGVVLTQHSVEQYKVLFEEATPQEVCDAIEHAKRTLVQLNPGWLRAVILRCQRQHCKPGEWPDQEARGEDDDEDEARAPPMPRAYVHPFTGKVVEINGESSEGSGRPTAE